MCDVQADSGSAEVEGAPVQYEFMAAVDAEDRKDKPLPLVRMTARIEPEWLIELFPDHVQERSTVEWNRAGERVEAVSALLYDELVIQESRGAAPDPGAAAGLLTSGTGTLPARGVSAGSVSPGSAARTATWS